LGEKRKATDKIVNTQDWLRKKPRLGQSAASTRLPSIASTTNPPKFCSWKKSLTKEKLNALDLKIRELGDNGLKWLL
jgi:hypothetical protein